MTKPNGPWQAINLAKTLVMSLRCCRSVSPVNEQPLSSGKGDKGRNLIIFLEEIFSN